MRDKSFIPVVIIGFGVLLSAVLWGNNHTVQATTPAVSQWVKVQSAAIRILSGSVPQKMRKPGKNWAALEIRLEPGWKTYWRSPGDTGVPPTFDWSKSANLKAIKVLWPSPHRFKEADSTAVGYKDGIILPLLITPKDPAKAVTLNLGLFLGVCKDICVPVQQKITFAVPAVARYPLSAIADIMRTVPVSLKPEQVHHHIKSLSLVMDNKKTYLQIEALFPKGSSGHDLLVEAPEEFYLPLTRLMGAGTKGSSRARLYRIDLSDVENPKTLVGQKLRVTLLSNKGSFDIETRLK